MCIEPDDCDPLNFLELRKSFGLKHPVSAKGWEGVLMKVVFEILDFNDLTKNVTFKSKCFKSIWLLFTSLLKVRVKTGSQGGTNCLPVGAAVGSKEPRQRFYSRRADRPLQQGAIRASLHAAQIVRGNLNSVRTGARLSRDARRGHKHRIPPPWVPTAMA